MNPVEEMLDDPELDQFGILDIDIRMRIWESRERLMKNQRFVERAIRSFGKMCGLHHSEIEALLIQVGNFYCDELDYMLSQPEEYLSIEEGYFRPSDNDDPHLPHIGNDSS